MKLASERKLFSKDYVYGGEPMAPMLEVARRAIPHRTRALAGSSSAFLCTHVHQSAGLHAHGTAKAQKSSVPELPGFCCVHVQRPAVHWACIHAGN